jgi:hypothetical protein
MKCLHDDQFRAMIEILLNGFCTFEELPRAARRVESFLSLAG